MILKFQITAGPDKGKEIRVPMDSRFTVGKSAKADFTQDDQELADIHFAIINNSSGCWLQDLAGSDTRLQGDTIYRMQRIREDGWFSAGYSQYRFAGSMADTSHVPKLLASFAPFDNEASAAQAVYQLLNPINRRGGLYALLDAARDEMVTPLLNSTELRYESLFKGKHAKELGAYGPVLLGLKPGAAVLEELLDYAWGNSWGIFLVCPEPFERVLEHLRSLLWVKTHKRSRKALYFRYYDPRVLRDFLPGFDEAVTKNFFGPIQHILMEAEKPEILHHFSLDNHGASHQKLALLNPALSMPTAGA